MHAAEEQVARGPSVGFFAKRKQIRLHRLGQARLEARLAVTLDMKGPVSVGPAAGSAKIGRSEAWGILVYSTGDASISAAMRNGGITRVHHVDQETTNILGLYAKYITVVYGE